MVYLLFGGNHYYHHQLLTVIEARDIEHAALALGTQVVGYFDRSKSNLPSVYYTSNQGDNNPCLIDGEESSFFLSLKELEPSDQCNHPDLEEKIRLKIIVL